MYLFYHLFTSNFFFSILRHCGDGLKYRMSLPLFIPWVSLEVTTGENWTTSLNTCEELETNPNPPGQCNEKANASYLRKCLCPAVYWYRLLLLRNFFFFLFERNRFSQRVLRGTSTILKWTIYSHSFHLIWFVSSFYISCISFKNNIHLFPLFPCMELMVLCGKGFTSNWLHGTT